MLPRELAVRFAEVTLLGEGAFGRVFRARRRETQEWVALKLLKSEFATDPQMGPRFRREARLGQRVQSRGADTLEGRLPSFEKDRPTAEQIAPLIERTAFLELELLQARSRQLWNFSGLTGIPRGTVAGLRQERLEQMQQGSRRWRTLR